MSEGLATYAANPNVGQYKGTSVTIPAPGPMKTKKKKETDEALKIIYQEMEEKLKQSVGTKVAITPGENGAGKLEIEFYNHDDLDRIADMLTKVQA